MKKVLFVNNVLWGGGAERILIDIVNNINNEEYDITVLTELEHSEPYSHLNKNIKYKYMNKKDELWGYDKKRFITYILRKIYNKINSYLMRFSLIKWKYSKNFKEKYDIIIAFKSGQSSKIPYLCNSNTPIIGWLHEDFNNFHTVEYVFYNKEQEKRMYECFDRVVAVSEHGKKSFEDFFDINKNTMCINNGVDIGRINKLSNDNIQFDDRKNSNITICSTMRLSEEKGTMTLLEAYNNLINRGLKVNLWIIGDGDLIEEVKMYIDKHNLDLVTLWGEQSNPYKIMKKADIYVCPSRTESFGISIVEALALGLPVVSTKNGGSEEVLDNGEYGILTENSSDALANGINEIIENKELYNDIKGKSYRRAERFSIQSTVDKLEELINEVICKRGE